MKASTLLTFIREKCGELPNEEVINMLKKIIIFMEDKKRTPNKENFLKSNKLDNFLSDDDISELNK